MADKPISSLPQAQTVDDTSLFVLEQQGTAMKATGAQWKAFAKDAVEQYVAPAQQAAQQAQQAAQQATQAVNQIGTAVEDTQANAEAAQDAQEAAEAAQTAAESAKTAAESAADGVEGYATAAEAAKNAAISAQTAAEQAEGNAESYATSASGSAQTATQSAQDAQGYASTASGSATTASQAAADAQEAAGLAQDAQDAIENLGVVGETLSPGEQVQVIKTVGEDGVVTLTFRIPQGLKGNTGDTGLTGPTGPQGVSVVSAEINDSGHLIITLSEGSPLDAGSAVGPQGIQGIQGPQGESIDSIQLTSGNHAPGTTDTYTVYSTEGSSVGTFNVYNGMDGLGAGDMLKSVYDPQNKNTDIFQYVDQKITALKQEILGMNFFVVQEGENV